LAVARDFNDKVPNTPEVLDVLGREEITAGNPGTAVEVFRRLIDLAPRSGRAYSLLASAQMLNQDTTGARQSLQTAMKVDEGYTPALLALIELETREKRYDVALGLAATVKDKQPKSSTGDMLRGDIMMAQQKYAEAVAAYEAGMTRENTPLLAVRRYNAQRAAKQDQIAAVTLEKWLASNDNPAARQVLANGYINDKNYPKAIEESEKIIATEKDNPIVLNNLAWLYQQTGDGRAKEYAEHAYQIAPKSAAVMDTLGWILVQGGDAKRGMELLRKAVEAAPTQGDIRYHMAAALQRSGRADDARKELEKLLAGGERMENFSTKADAERLLRQLKGGG
jgi:putative PEP-CTERM system TPR-repeat lipoprotein